MVSGTTNLLFEIDEAILTREKASFRVKRFFGFFFNTIKKITT
jgi:hypothetical protein